MPVMLIRANVKPEHTEDVEEAAKAVFAALDQPKPQGIRYTSYRLLDNSSYLILFEVQDGANNPLPTIAEFRNFQELLAGWLTEPTSPQPLAVVRLCWSPAEVPRPVDLDPAVPLGPDPRCSRQQATFPYGLSSTPKVHLTESYGGSRMRPRTRREKTDKGERDGRDGS